jgi:cellobiose phosphorylase
LVLGYEENDLGRKWEADGNPNLESARAVLDRVAVPEFVDGALAALRSGWEDLLGRFRLESPVPEFDRTVNIWNPRQCAVVYHIARSASYFESGIGRGIGFRDTCQDLLGFVHMMPDEARGRLLAVAAIQKEDGGAYHQFQPLTGRGNEAIGGDFNDDPLWLILAVSAYVKETGDWAVLEEPVPFDHDPRRGAPLFEHLERAFRKVGDNRGPHGLPRIGRADWNDCLNLNSFSEDPDESFQTDLIGNPGSRRAFFWRPVLLGRAGSGRVGPPRGRPVLAEETRSDAEGMREARRPMDGTGLGIGGRMTPSGRGGGGGVRRRLIYLEVQGICAMAGVGRDEGWPGTALDSVVRPWRRLMGCFFSIRPIPGITPNWGR